MVEPAGNLLTCGLTLAHFLTFTLGHCARGKFSTTAAITQAPALMSPVRPLSHTSSLKAAGAKGANYPRQSRHTLSAKCYLSLTHRVVGFVFVLEPTAARLPATFPLRLPRFGSNRSRAKLLAPQVTQALRGALWCAA